MSVNSTRNPEMVEALSPDFRRLYSTTHSLGDAIDMMQSMPVCRAIYPGSVNGGRIVTSGGGIPEAPVDGSIYARGSGAWQGSGGFTGPIGIGGSPTAGNLHIFDATQPIILLEDTGGSTQWEIKTIDDQFELNLVGSGGAELLIDGGIFRFTDGGTQLVQFGTTGSVFMRTVSVTEAVPVLELQQQDLSEEFVNFIATIGAGNPIDTAATGTYYGKIRVAVNGTFKYMALYNS